MPLARSAQSLMLMATASWNLWSTFAPFVRAAEIKLNVPLRASLSQHCVVKCTPRINKFLANSECVFIAVESAKGPRMGIYHNHSALLTVAQLILKCEGEINCSQSL